MTAEAVPYISEEEYLDGEVRSEVRHEYYDGRVMAMAGASDSHELVSGNFFFHLTGHLRGKGCRVYKSDMKVRLFLRGKPLFYYPDVMVACDPNEPHPLYRERPRLIVEVLSDDENKDLVEKLLAYQRIESLEEYVVASPQADAPVVHIFRRAEGWEPGETHTGTETEFELRSIGLRLRVADLFTV